MSFHIQWPRGKYNGRRIEGFKLTFSIHILAWRWMPLLHWNFGEPVFIWLCFTVRVCAEYEFRAPELTLTRKI
jgi:hypothetical protein